MNHIPDLTSTYSKSPRNFPDTYPQQLVCADGPYVWDDNGRRSVDWSGCLGANLLGHRHPAIQERLVSQLHEGIVFPLPHQREARVAEQLCQLTGWEQCRFAKSGSDVTEAAVRIARYTTGKSIILTTGYHGSHSDLVSATPGKSGGVLGRNQATVEPMTSATDLLEILQTQRDIAAVLAEPIQLDGTIWPWREIKAACQKVGTLLIFDEIICGFRYRAAGFSPEFQPALACYGKALANGMPLAALCGPWEYMRLLENEVFMSGTASAECLSLAAASAVLDTITPECRELRQVHLVGEALIAGCRTLGIDTIGLPPRFQFRFPSDASRDHFLSGMCQRGHLLTRDMFPTTAHTLDHVNNFLTAAHEVFDAMP